MKFYLSCRKELPESAIMDAELGVTLEDWADIPTHELPDVCAEARRRSKGFPPANSLAVDVWAEECHRRYKKTRDLTLYLAPHEIEPDVVRTPEELAAIKKLFDGIRAAL